MDRKSWKGVRRADDGTERCRNPLQREPDRTRVRRQLTIAERVIIDLRNIKFSGTSDHRWLRNNLAPSSGETGVCRLQVMR